MNIASRLTGEVSVMPFSTPMRPYTKEDILNIKPDQRGVYGIFKGNTAIYVGSGDLRERMLAHVDGDNSCITESLPDEWTAGVVSGDPTVLEGQLIREYDPACNQVVPS